MAKVLMQVLIQVLIHRCERSCRLRGWKTLLVGSAALLALGGCLAPMGERDGGPARPVDVSRIPDAVPRVEPRTKAGNKSPYTVLGKTYHVLPDSRGFTQHGSASWYGTKFHGRRTSNGEIYNMYGMTAAHKTLPIPSYVRVTNRNNGRSVVVRVNDRGPFHGDRIIDLTYSAASKLGFADQGTAPVEIVALAPGLPGSPPRAQAAASNKAVTVQAAPRTKLPVASRADTAVKADDAVELGQFDGTRRVDGYLLPNNTFLQAGAFGSEAAAVALQRQIAGLTHFPVLVQAGGERTLYRVRIGPIRDNLELLNLRETLQKNRLAIPHVVYD